MLIPGEAWLPAWRDWSVTEGPPASAQGVTGRAYHLFDYHGAPDAERVIVVMGSLLQGIFPTQELNWDLLHCRWILY